MIRWLDLSGKHLIFRPNQTSREHPLIPIELDESDQPDPRPDRLVLELLQPAATLTESGDRRRPRLALGPGPVGHRPRDSC